MLITIYSAILGLVTGFAYSLSLHFDIEDGLLYGTCAGLFLGLVLAVFNKFMIARKNVNQKTTVVLSGYLMILLLVVSVGSSIIVWVFRVTIF